MNIIDKILSGHVQTWQIKAINIIFEKNIASIPWSAAGRVCHPFSLLIVF